MLLHYMESSRRWTYFPAVLRSEHLSARKSGFQIVSMKLLQWEATTSLNSRFYKRLAWEVTVMCGSPATVSLCARFVFSNHHSVYSLALEDKQTGSVPPFHAAVQLSYFSQGAGNVVALISQLGNLQHFLQ